MAAFARHSLDKADPVSPLLLAEQEAWAAFIAASDVDADTSNALGAVAADALAALMNAEAPSPAALAAMIDTTLARNGDDWVGDQGVMRLLTLALATLAPEAAPPVWRSEVT